MGFSAEQIADKCPPWWHFLFPADETDRKNWSVTIAGTTYVSSSKAMRPSNSIFINSSTMLEICPICKSVLNNRYLVTMRYYVYKEDYTSTDLLNWQTQFLKACYIHWRTPGSKLIENRNPWTCENYILKRTTSSSQASTQSSPSQLGEAVLPSYLL